MIRSVLAVAAGFAASGALMVLSGLMMAFLGEGSKGPASAAVVRLGAACLVLEFLYGAIGAWLCVRIARRQPWKHLLALVAVGALLLTASFAAFRGTQPAWYGLGLLAVFAPAVFLGGRAATARTTHNETDVLAGSRK
jgi:peptidoglycan/LPS O-acetylase OafA/YrhL